MIFLFNLNLVKIKYSSSFRSLNRLHNLVSVYLGLELCNPIDLF